MNDIHYLAPAKLNLFLHITSQRPDGYHCLQTIFQFIDYCDDLYFNQRTDGVLSCQSTAKELPPEQDLVLQAARVLQEYAHTSFGVDIRVNKKIPIGGGLGGGSSDAATVLLALNNMWQLGLSYDILAKIGLRLGADVPVFIYGQAAWAEGIGESLRPITLEEPWYLVIHPGCFVSTSDIFAEKDLTRNRLSITMDDFIGGRCTNVCEEIVCRRHPQVKKAMEWLNQYSPARLTGTGACLFARFEERKQAQAVLSELPSEWHGFVAQGKNTSPAHNNMLE